MTSLTRAAYSLALGLVAACGVVDAPTPNSRPIRPLTETETLSNSRARSESASNNADLPDPELRASPEAPQHVGEASAARSVALAQGSETETEAETESESRGAATIGRAESESEAANETENANETANQTQTQQRRSPTLAQLIESGRLPSPEALGRQPRTQTPEEVSAEILRQLDRPDAPAPTDEAATLEFRLAHASHEAPEGVPTTVVHVPAGFDASRPYSLVVFLHGWNGCARQYVPRRRIACKADMPASAGWGLGRVHDEVGANSLLVVPQLGWLVRNGEPGRFAEAGYAAAWLGELIEEHLAPVLGAGRDLSSVHSIVIASHSAGFEVADRMLQVGGLDSKVTAVLLLDSLYDYPDRFGAWAFGAPNRRLVSVHRGRGHTRRHSATLERLSIGEHGEENLLLGELSAVHERIGDQPVSIITTETAHGAIPRVHLGALLSALGLPNRASIVRENQ